MLFLQVMQEMRADPEIVKEYVIFAGEGYVKIQTEYVLLKLELT